MTIKLLFLAANPTDTDHLRLDEEYRAIDQSVQTARFRDQFEIKPHGAVRVGDLQKLLLRYKPEIVHFSGHGSSASEIILEDDEGHSQSVPQEALSKLFAILKDNVRCVVLNACYTEDQAQAIAAHVDCVVSMSGPISDSASVCFATAFYGALVDGKDVQTAFDLGCNLIDTKGFGEQDVPKLIATRCDPKKVVLTAQPHVFNGQWILGPLAAIAIGDIIIQYSKLWQGNLSTSTYLGLGVGLALLLGALVWVGFRRKPERVGPDANGKFKKVYRPCYIHAYRWAWLGLVLVVAGGGMAGYLLYQQQILESQTIAQQQILESKIITQQQTLESQTIAQQQILESKIIILVTEIHGPELENYRVTEELLTQLKDELSTYDDTLVIGISENITAQQGSEYARELGKQYTADIVLWGWYGATNSNARLTLNIENLNERQFIDLGPHKTLQSQTRIADLASFTVQQNISGQMSALLLFLRGVARYQADDFINALDNFDKALNYPEWNDELVNKKNVLYYRGHIFSLQGQNEKAIENYTQTIQLDPQYSGNYNDRGIAYENNGEYDKAIADYTQAIQLDPQYSAIYYINRGGTYLKKNENDKAIEDFTRTIQLAPNFGNAYYARGVAYGNNGEYDKAIADYTQSIQLDPKFMDAYYNRGLIYEDKGENDKAIADFTQIIQLAPIFLGVYQNAVADYTQATQLDPKFLDAYYHRGVAYENKDEHDKAIADYTKAIQLAQKYGDAHRNRAIAYDNKGEHGISINENLLALYYLTKKCADIHYNRGIAYENKGEHDKAISDFTQAIRLNPKDSASHIYRGNIYGSKGEYDKAIADYTEAIQLDPKDAASFFNRALLYCKLGKNDLCLRDLKQAQQLTQDPAHQAEINNLLRSLPTP